MEFTLKRCGDLVRVFHVTARNVVERGNSTRFPDLIHALASADSYDEIVCPQLSKQALQGLVPNRGKASELLDFSLQKIREQGASIAEMDAA